MRVGLIDVDGHNFPNLALMRISSYHKARGDEVEWCFPMYHYDIVYKSKVFSDDYTPDVPDPLYADKIIKGGSGYAIRSEDGIEVYHKEFDQGLPDEIEHCFPDYSLYPQYQYAVAMTSRGCPRGCAFCHVAGKEGRRSVKVADVSDFWNPSTGFKKIVSIDPNILACRDRIDLLKQYKSTGCKVEFNQGLDIRMIDEDILNTLSGMKMDINGIHFAWDNPDDDLEEKFKLFADANGGNYNSHGKNGTVYCLTNFGNYTEQEHLERLLMRVYKLRDLGFKPYVMIYDKPNSAKLLREAARWVNNQYVFYKVKNFEEYNR